MGVGDPAGPKPTPQSDTHFVRVPVSAVGYRLRWLNTFPENKGRLVNIAVYCGSGKRSAIASKQLSDNGYNVLNMDGGLMAWKASGLPIVK